MPLLAVDADPAWWAVLITSLGTTAALLIREAYKYLKAKPGIAGKEWRAERKDIVDHYEAYIEMERRNNAVRVESLQKDVAAERHNVAELRKLFEEKLTECASLRMENQYLRELTGRAKP